MSNFSVWSTASLASIAIKIQDGTHFSPQSLDGPCRYVTSKNIRFGFLDLKDCGWISELEHKAIYARCDVQYGDVLLTKDGANTGNAALNSLNEEFSLLSSVAFIRLDRTMADAQYVLQVLISPFGQRLLKEMMSGNAITRLTLAKIKAFQIPIPPLPTQRRIAAVLRTVDEVIEATEARIEKQQAIKQGLLHDLFTRGVTPDGQLRPPPSERPDLYRESELGVIPREWEIQNLVSIARRITDGTHLAVSTSEGGTVPFLFVSCVREDEIRWDVAGKINDATFRSISRGREPETGMILYTAVGSYGYAALVRRADDFAFQRHIACIYPAPSKINGEFLVAWLNHPRVRAYADSVAVGNAQKSVTLGALSEFPVAVPESSEQAGIADSLSSAKARVSELNARLSKLRHLKSALMQDLLTGRVSADSINLESLTA